MIRNSSLLSLAFHFIEGFQQFYFRFILPLLFLSFCFEILILLVNPLDFRLNFPIKQVLLSPSEILKIFKDFILQYYLFMELKIFLIPLTQFTSNPIEYEFLVHFLLFKVIFVFLMLVFLNFINLFILNLKDFQVIKPLPILTHNLIFQIIISNSSFRFELIQPLVLAPSHWIETIRTLSENSLYFKFMFLSLQSLLFLILSQLFLLFDLLTIPYQIHLLVLLFPLLITLQKIYPVNFLLIMVCPIFSIYYHIFSL